MQTNTKKIILKKDGTPDMRYIKKLPKKEFKFTPEEILVKFKDYVDEKGFETKRKTRSTETLDGGSVSVEEDIRYVPLSIIGFSLYLNVNSKYLYGLPEEKYGETIDYINSLLEQHITTGIAIGDIAQSFGIFYLKNKFGYRDVKQIEADVKQEITTNSVDLTDKELMDILND